MINLRNYFCPGDRFTGTTVKYHDQGKFKPMTDRWIVKEVYPHWMKVASRHGTEATFDTGDLVISKAIDGFIQNPTEGSDESKVS